MTFATTPRLTGVSTVTIGQSSLLAAFEPLEDGDVIPRVFGPQGAAMIETRYRIARIEGSTVSCVPVTTEIRIPGGPTLKSYSNDLAVYSQDDGTSLTRSYFAVLDWASELQAGNLVEMTVVVGTTIVLGGNRTGSSLLYIGVGNHARTIEVFVE